MNNFSISNKFRYIFLIQAVTVFLLYVYLPGRVSMTLTAFQPDSINSLCMGITRFQQDLEGVNRILGSISKTFYGSGFNLACANDLTPPYRTRLVLSFLIGIFSILGPWWFVLLPSILIYFAIGLVYWLIISKYFKSINYMSLIWYLPFFSPHIGWFLANVMTEGPLLLFLLLITYITYVRRIKNQNLELAIVLLLSVLSLLSKQSWPLVTVVFAAYLIRRFARFSAPVIYATTLLFSLAVSSLAKALGSSMYGKDFGKWNDLAIFENPGEAIKGVFLGLRADTVHLFAFGDIFGVVGICMAIWIIVFKVRQLEIKITLLCATGWGLATIGSVYLADGSYGQNWRFMVFAFVLAFPLYLIDRQMPPKVDYSGKS